MDIAALVILAGVLIFAAHLFSWIFSYTKIPDALLFITAGLLLGPIFGLLAPEYFGQAGGLIVTLILIIVLFQSGLHLNVHVLKGVWRRTIALAVVSFTVTMLLTAAVLVGIFQLQLTAAVIAGSILGGTSSTVVIPLLRQISPRDKTEATLTVEAVFSDVLVIVVTLALLHSVETGSFSLLWLGWNVLMSFFGAAVIGTLAAVVWARLGTLIHRLRYSIFLTPALVLLLFGVTEKIGFSGLIAVLVFSVFMGNVFRLHAFLEQRHAFLRYVLWPTAPTREEHLVFDEVAFLLQTFFFVLVGLSMPLNEPAVLAVGLLLSSLMIVTRFLVVRGVAARGTAEFDAEIMAIMIPKGLAAAALAILPVQAGLAGGIFIQNTVYATILFSIALTSLLVFYIHVKRVRAEKGVSPGFAEYGN